MIDSEVLDGARARTVEKIGATSLDGLATFLDTAAFDPRKKSYEALINPSTDPITAPDLQRLLGFPYEFMLRERMGNIAVTTEDPRGATMKPSDTAGPFFMHTHPNESGAGNRIEC